jgi:hypothetical protein
MDFVRPLLAFSTKVDRAEHRNNLRNLQQPLMAFSGLSTKADQVGDRYSSLLAFADLNSLR